MFLYTYYRSHGECIPYTGGSDPSICDEIFQVGIDYVYFQKSRFLSPSQLRWLLEQYSPAVRFLQEPCKDVAASLICTHVYAPCGNNTSVHVPTFVCPDVCEYVSTELCADEWAQATDLILTIYGEQANLQLPNCSHPGEHLAPLHLSSDCCVNANVTLPG